MNDLNKKTTFFDKIGVTPNQIAWLMAANLFYALALDLFYVHNNIAAGGLAGIGTVLNSLFGLPVGAVVGPILPTMSSDSSFAFAQR